MKTWIKLGASANKYYQLHGTTYTWYVGTKSIIYLSFYKMELTLSEHVCLFKEHLWANISPQTSHSNIMTSRFIWRVDNNNQNALQHHNVKILKQEPLDKMSRQLRRVLIIIWAAELARGLASSNLFLSNRVTKIVRV